MLSALSNAVWAVISFFTVAVCVVLKRSRSAASRFEAISTATSLLSSPDMTVSKQAVNKTVANYENLFSGARTSVGQISTASSVECRKNEYTTMVDAFYNIVTDFYEWGWGPCFHFAPRWATETFRESIKRSEGYMAYRLGMSPQTKALDVGCGIGGPMRNMHEFSGSDITGITLSQYQVNIGNKYNAAQGHSAKCRLIQGDYQKLPQLLPAASFDCAFAIESTVHSPDRVITFSGVNHCLKKGGTFALYEWVLLDNFDEKNRDHVRIKEGIEVGNGIPTLTSVSYVLDSLEKAGFDVVDHFDANQGQFDKAQIPWFETLNGKWSIQGFRMTRLGRLCTKIMVNALEFAGIAPKGSTRVASFLNATADDLTDAGKLQIFTPSYFILARKR